MKTPLALCFFLVACGSADVRSDRQDGTTQTTTPETPVVYVALDWDHSPTAVVFDAIVWGGYVPWPDSVSTTTSLRLFGDGRMVGGNPIIETKLSQDEMRTLVNEIASAGVNDWVSLDDPYLADASTESISFNTTSGSKVVDMYGQSTEAFRALTQRARSFFGYSGTPYLPTSGKLVAEEWEGSADGVWPSSTGVSLAAVASSGQTPVSGDALAAAWAAVRGDENLQEDHGKIYLIGLRVDELALNR